MLTFDRNSFSHVAGSASKATHFISQMYSINDTGNWDFEIPRFLFSLSKHVSGLRLELTVEQPWKSQSQPLRSRLLATECTRFNKALFTSVIDINNFNFGQ